MSHERFTVDETVCFAEAHVYINPKGRLVVMAVDG